MTNAFERAPILHRFGCWLIGFGLTLSMDRANQKRAVGVPFALLGQTVITQLNRVHAAESRASTHAKRRHRG